MHGREDAAMYDLVYIFIMYVFTTVLPFVNNFLLMTHVTKIKLIRFEFFILNAIASVNMSVKPVITEK